MCASTAVYVVADVALRACSPHTTLSLRIVHKVSLSNHTRIGSIGVEPVHVRQRAGCDDCYVGRVACELLCSCTLPECVVARCRRRIITV